MQKMRMIIRMYPIIGLKGQQITAQGNALGVMAAVATPCKGKSIILNLSATSRAMPSTDAFAPSFRFQYHRLPRAMPWSIGSLPLGGVVG